VKVRNVVVQKSGEHSDNPYDYVEVALTKTKCKKLLGELPLYYFCLKASFCDDFDKRFQPFMSEVFKGDSATEFESMSFLTNDSRRMKVDDFNNDNFMVTMKKIEVSQHSMSQSQSMLATQQKRNAELEELETLQSMHRSRQSPISAVMKNRIEQRMNTLMGKLFPGEEE
jgi:hypothetical protein